jgi:hypothetical protein
MNILIPQYGGLHCRNEFGKLADIDAYSMSTKRYRFNEARSAADIGVKDVVTWVGERVDRRTNEGWREASRISVEVVRQSLYNLNVTCSLYERHFGRSR